MTLHILGSYTFYRNPHTLSIPETKKPVSVVETWGGSAIFQWDALISGQSIEMTWPGMEASMYEELRTLYLEDDSVVWNPQNGSTYNVIVTNLEGEYIEAGHAESPYRKNVMMTLNIRSAV